MHPSRRHVARLVALLVAAVLAATALEVVPRRVRPALAEETVPQLPAPEPEPDLPLGEAVTEPRTGFVEGVSVADRRLWTAGSRTWRNPDNSLTTRAYGGVVNFQNPAGLWQAIDSTIVAADGGGFGVAAAPYGIRFGATSSSSTLVSFTHGASTVSFAPPLGALADIAPVVEANTITYPGILPGVDLRYTVGRFLLKEDLILTAAPSALLAPVFQFPISTANASVSPRADGGFDLHDADGEKVFTIPAGFMADASPATWAPPNHGPVSLTLSDVVGGKVLSVAPDLAWLLDPARQYPVYIDPTVQTHGSVCFWHACQGTSVDAEVFQGYPDWTGDQNWVGFLGRWIDDVGGEAGPWERISYLHYDAGVFTYSNINWGHWQGYWAWKECAGGTEHWIWPTAGAWNNGAGAPDGWMPPITWNRRLYSGDAWHFGDQGVVYVATDTGWNRWDITAWVRNWASTAWANRGIQIDTQGPGNCRFRRLAAHENGDGSDSYLEVDHWDPSPNVPSLSSPGHGSKLTATPQLAAVYSDPNGEPGYVRFNVYRRSDNALVAGASVGTVCSGCTAYWTPPALGDGNYWWNAYGYDDVSRGGDSGGWWFDVDSTAPSPPSISSSTHPNPNAWSATNAPSFSWSAGDTSGICAYAHSVSSASAADPGYTSQGTATSYTSPARADGVWYFNVRAQNCAGLWGAYGSYRVQIDADGPSAPSVASSTHPDPNAWYAGRRPSLSWSASDGSGICDYSYLFDQSATTDPGTTLNANKGTGSAWTKPDDAPDGDSWFHIRAKNCAGVWGGLAHRRLRVDGSPPPAPTISSSTHPSQDAWSTNATPSFSWTAGDLSGIDGYSRNLDQSPSYTPDTTSEGTATTWASTALADGEWWFHLRARNGAGTWGTPESGVGHYRVRIDTTKPAAPAAASPSHPDPERWYADNTPEFAWSASDTSGIVDYAYVLDQSPATDPAPAQAGKGPAMAWTATAVADGTWWFHLAARNGAGQWSDPVHVKVRVETGAPAAPTVGSTSHPDATAWYADDTAEFAFSSAGSLSGLAGYYVAVNQIPVMDPDQTTPAPGGTYTTPPVSPDGVWYFHVRAINGVGVLGPSTHRAFRVDITRPSPPAIVVSTTHAPNFASSDPTIEVIWDGALDVPSGVAGFDWQFSAGAAPPAAYNHNTPDGLGPEAATSPAQPEGEVWFHVRAVDRAGNLSDDRALGPFFVDPDAPGDPVSLATTLLPNLVAQSDELGLEQWAPYRQVPLGGNGTGYVQLRTGNLVASFEDASVPGVGLNTVIRHTYNARRGTASQHDNGLGLGWTLSVADLEAGLEGVDGAIEDLDVLAPITVAAPRIIESLATTTGSMLEFTDGDGTTHRFVRDGGPNSRWSAPPGVSLRVREVYDAGAPLLPSAYELIRPDGVVYRAERVETSLVIDPWRIVSVSDRRANTLSYRYGLVAGAVRLLAVDSNDPGAGRVAELAYDAGTARLERITTLPGVTAVDPATGASRPWARTVEFAYTAGRLSQVTENAHTTVANGRRSTTLAYDPASGLLTGVTDPRGKTTAIAYTGAPDGPRVTAVTDRRAKAWGFAYGAPDASGQLDTTATAPAPAGPTVYRSSGRGPVSDTDRRIAGGNLVRLGDAGANAGPVATTYRWAQNRLVGVADAAGAETRLRYNDLGLLIETTEPRPNDPSTPGLPAGAATEPVRSSLAYTFPDGPGAAYRAPDCSAPAPGEDDVTREGWCQAVGELVRTTFADNYGPSVARITDFAYERGDGLLTAVTQRGDGTGNAAPTDRTTTFDYYARGALKRIDGPRPDSDARDVTTFGDGTTDPYGGYHRSGQPLTITDADTKTKRFAYTPYGLVAKVTDRNLNATKTRYDERDNPVEVTDPENEASTFVYDANDWRTRETTARGTVTTTAYNDLGQVTQVSKHGTVTRTTYHDDGTKASDVNPLGGITNYTYWPNQALRLVKSPTAASVGAKAETEHLYDSLGRLAETRSPVANAAGDRPVAHLAYTPDGKLQTRRETTAVAGQLAETRTVYNAHNEVVETRGPRANAAGERATETNTLNNFGEVTLSRRLLDGGRWIDSRAEYDHAGNATLTTQATGVPGDSVRELVTRYTFDALGRIARQTDPVNFGHVAIFSYTPEGQQSERADYLGYHPSRPLADVALSELVRLRQVTTRFNPDNTQRETVHRDDTTGRTLASCNFAGAGETANPDYSSGYDADGNLLVTRTVEGTGGCAAGGTLLREQTFTDYDPRGWIRATTQRVRVPGSSTYITRSQNFTHTADGQWDTATHAGRTIDYTYSDGGWLESMVDWRGRPTSHTFHASGAPRTTNFGTTVANAEFTYHGDGSMASLVWKAGAAQNVVRSHTAIGYDIGGLRKHETVQVAQPVGSTASSAPGTATFSYDLVDRLTSWTSPFPDNGGQPVTTWVLDDGGNTREESIHVGAALRSETINTYDSGRITDRRVHTYGTLPLEGEITNYDFDYTGLGEESRRSVGHNILGGGTPLPPTKTSTWYDPAGHTKTVFESTDIQTTPQIDYVYDTADRLISRRTQPGTGPLADTTLYFYWGSGGNLAEETDANGNLKVRYLPDEDGEPIAQEKPGPLPTTTWAWLLPDTNGNVATHVDDTGTVTEQAAYDPYGKKDQGGSSKGDGQPSSSSLGFQGALTDPVTGSVILGARQYDPGIGRFLTPDVFVASSLDVELGTDDLTGNRYLFAAANPVAFYEDGYWPSMPKFVKKMAKRALPLLSFVPVVGTAIDVVSAATGRDWLNGGRKLSGAERALMLAGAAVGMIPAAGTAAKASLKVAAKLATKGRTAAKVANAVTKHVDEVAEVVGAVCRRAPNSFTPGTRVLMADGTTRPIEAVDVGEHVLATDPETGQTASKPVTAVIEGEGPKHLVELTINGYAVTATGGHPFWVAGRGWIDAEEVNPGELVLEADGDLEAVTAKRTYDVAHAKVHNLTVADLHTYYVLVGEPVLVHNSGCAPQVATNRAAGNAFRDDTARRLSDEGWEIVDTEVRVNTPFGPRYTDILAERNGGLVGFETKWGSSRYHTSQRAKDRWISRQGGTARDGSLLQYPTVLVRSRGPV